MKSYRLVKQEPHFEITLQEKLIKHNLTLIAKLHMFATGALCSSILSCRRGSQCNLRSLYVSPKQLNAYPMTSAYPKSWWLPLIMWGPAGSRRGAATPWCLRLRVNCKEIAEGLSTESMIWTSGPALNFYFGLRSRPDINDMSFHEVTAVTQNGWRQSDNLEHLECSRYRILWLPLDIAKIVTISNKNTNK